ncbi:serine protease snake-like [Schistocerca gregaria]|uniref:serine protease snake-like n=1 Tax=Schistocerca gregaria TaxID=7010 RepID=UPI00211F212F|nr:serine protease snake-like [Schistocerca gregaria]
MDRRCARAVSRSPAARLLPLAVALLLAMAPTAADPGDKSQAKCKEYARAVFVESEAPVLLPRALPTRESVCGIVGVPLIVGGIKTGPREFPHMAVIGYGDEEEIDWMCGGSLISETYILTAAHCLSSHEKGPARWVRLGDVNLEGRNRDANPQQVAVAERVAHPGYRPPGRYDDVALLRLQRAVHFDAYTRPACLHAQPDLPAAVGVATGFGKIDFASKTTSKDLLKVRLPFISHADCEAAFSADRGSRKLRDGIREDSMLCAGDMKGGKDTCQGDSGGPLQVPLHEPYCMYGLVGVTSFGKFCGFENSPAVYSRVSHYVPWIESVVWP